jgi:hypothetical protein
VNNSVEVADVPTLRFCDAPLHAVLMYIVISVIWLFAGTIIPVDAAVDD